MALPCFFCFPRLASSTPLSLCAYCPHCQNHSSISYPHGSLPHLLIFLQTPLHQREEAFFAHRPAQTRHRSPVSCLISTVLCCLLRLCDESPQNSAASSSHLLCSGIQTGRREVGLCSMMSLRGEGLCWKICPGGLESSVGLFPHTSSGGWCWPKHPHKASPCGLFSRIRSPN